MKKLIILITTLVALSVAVDVTYQCYDFRSTFPDMHMYITKPETIDVLAPGALLRLLDSEGKPVLVPPVNQPPIFPFTDEETFSVWYRPDGVVNSGPHAYIADFTENNGQMSYNNPSFFPLDGRGFNDEVDGHNHFFTCETSFQFDYNPGCTMRFKSDDDMWIFVNGVLLGDLGGLHQDFVSDTFINPHDIITILNDNGVYPVEGEPLTMQIFSADRQPTESSVYINTCESTETPGTNGDPHIFGFLGQKFDFHGDADKTFNVITDHNIQLNAKVVDADLAPSFKKKTYFGSFGFKLGTDKIFIACDRALNPEDEGYGQGHIIEVNGVNVANSVNRSYGGAEYEMKISEKRHRMTIEHEVYTLTVQFSSSARSSCHLNLRAAARSHKSIQQATKRIETNHMCPHGVLGQTIRPTPQVTSKGRNGEGVVEGIYTSYMEMNDQIFGDNFQFNCFNPANNVLIGGGISDDEAEYRERL